MKKQIYAFILASALICTEGYTADIALYGTIDLGLLYSKSEYGGVFSDHRKYPDTQSITMKAGGNSGNRFGIQGKEELAAGYSVEFKLESGFASDTGALGQGGRLFGRESRLTLNTPYGSISFGRMGGLTSSSGTYNIFTSNADAMGYCNYIGTYNWVNRSRYDNVITLVTPTAAGLTGYAQYSFRTNGEEEDHTHRNERYAALGMTYSAGALNMVLVADTILKATEEKVDGVWKRAEDADYDNAWSLGFGINYDFGGFKLILGGQYGKNEQLAYKTSEGILRYDGYNVCLGYVSELKTGKLEAKVYYGDYDHSRIKHSSAKTYGAAFMNTYSITKRTAVYVGAGYYQFDIGARIAEKDGMARTKGFDFTFGLKHKF